jgi:hypothetical protein
MSSEKNKPKVENILGICLKGNKLVKSDKVVNDKSPLVNDKLPKSTKISNIKENKILMKSGKRRCKNCNEIKELKWFGKKDKNRWYTICRSCNSINAENRILFDEGLRRCKECRRILPLLQFDIKSVEIKGKVYRNTVCKDCMAEFKKK